MCWSCSETVSSKWAVHHTHRGLIFLSWELSGRPNIRGHVIGVLAKYSPYMQQKMGFRPNELHSIIVQLLNFSMPKKLNGNN